MSDPASLFLDRHVAAVLSAAVCGLLVSLPYPGFAKSPRWLVTAMRGAFALAGVLALVVGFAAPASGAEIVAAFTRFGAIVVGIVSLLANLAIAKTTSRNTSAR